MNAMAMYYGPEVLYKNNLISNIMNFNESQRNFREKTMKKKWFNLQNDLYYGNQKSYSAENGIKWCLGQYYNILNYNLRVIWC